jgi:hypothetical protein
MCADDAPEDPAEIARILDTCVRQACSDLGMAEADVFSGGPTVTMLLSDTAAWEAVILGPDAYQLYPGFLRDDGETLVWANVWVATPYDLAKFATVLTEELAAAAR